MKIKILFVLLALAILAVAGYFVFLRQSTPKDSVADKSDSLVATKFKERAARKTPMVTHKSLKERLEKMRSKVAAIKDSPELRNVAKRSRSSYPEGLGKASAESVSVLDDILAKSENDNALSEQSRLTIEKRLTESSDLKGVKIDGIECSRSFCRARFIYEKAENMTAFLGAIDNGWTWNKRPHFIFSRNKGVITSVADIQNQASIETLVYFSNSAAPLPIDEKLQQARQ